MRELIDVEAILTKEQIARANALGLEDWCHPHQLRLLREQAREICSPPTEEEDAPLHLLFDLDSEGFQQMRDRTRQSWETASARYATPTPAAHLAKLVLEYRWQRETAQVAAEIVAADPHLAAMLDTRSAFLAQEDGAGAISALA
jgi:hypothetical protein